MNLVICAQSNKTFLTGLNNAEMDMMQSLTGSSTLSIDKATWGSWNAEPSAIKIIESHCKMHEHTFYQVS